MAATTPRTRKAKGRVYQQEIVAWLLQMCGYTHLLSTIMGMWGTDVGDPYAELPWSYTECKRLEKSPSLAEIEVIMSKKRIKDRSWCFFSRQSRQPTLVVMPLETLAILLRSHLRIQSMKEAKNAGINSGVSAQ